MEKIEIENTTFELEKMFPYKIEGKEYTQNEVNNNEKLQMVAVEESGLAIEYIKNPSIEVQMAAVKQYGLAIKYIKNPSEELKKLAVKQNSYAIEYIENPSTEVQLAAVRENGDAIEYIDNPSEEVFDYLFENKKYILDEYYKIKKLK